MKLDELMGVKKFKNMTSAEIMKYIEKEFEGTDVKVLGDGANAVAVKIGKFAYKFWFIDDAYSAFVNYVLKNPDNPYLPKLYGKPKTIPAFFLKHEDAPARVNYIKMELLTPSTLHPNTAVNLNNGRQINLTNFFDTLDRWMKMDYSEEFMRKTAFVEFMIARGSLEAGTKLSDLPTDTQLLINTLVDLFFINPDGDMLDLHSENYMYRGKQPVIIDPMADFQSLQLNNTFAKFNKELRDKNET